MRKRQFEFVPPVSLSVSDSSVKMTRIFAMGSYSPTLLLAPCHGTTPCHGYGMNWFSGWYGMIWYVLDYISDSR
jgi:hypothetical protein